MKTLTKVLLAAVLVISLPGPFSQAEEDKLNVLVVMSYEKPEMNPWCREIKEGIESVLAAACNIDYFYMDTKINLAGGSQKAEQAYALYKGKQYDGVITADDNAQKMFVVPYLKDLVKTPVMFCGVNADPKKYGFPATNVSGIIERGHFRESVALLKQLMPKITKMGFVIKDSPSGRALKEQIAQEADTYIVKITAFELVNTLNDIEKNGNLKKCDAFFVDSIEGIQDQAGKLVNNKNIISFITSIFGKPVVGANTYHVTSGAFCAVVKTGQEQGSGAATGLLAAMRGKPVSSIPITRNFEGKRLINVTVMKELGIKPKPISLLGAQLVKTRN